MNEGTCEGDQRELTFGEKAVGLKFNPGGDPTVSKVKKLYAEIIDICNNPNSRVDSFEKDLHREAVMSAVTAQMAAVKLITWNS